MRGVVSSGKVTLSASIPFGAVSTSGVVSPLCLILCKFNADDPAKYSLRTSKSVSNGTDTA